VSNLPNTGSIFDRGLSFTPDIHILCICFPPFCMLNTLIHFISPGSAFILSHFFTSPPPPRQPFRPKSAVREYGVDLGFCAPLIPGEVLFSHVNCLCMLYEEVSFYCPVCVQSMQNMGNSRARAVYEARLPDDFR
jgi:hypothetical protein